MLLEHTDVMQRSPTTMPEDRAASETQSESSRSAQPPATVTVVEQRGTRPVQGRQQPRQERQGGSETPLHDEVLAVGQGVLAKTEVAPAPERTAVLLSPRAAALTMFEVDRGQTADAGVSDSVERAERALEASLMKGVTRPKHFSGEPVLRPGLDGGYVYDGTGFSATIRSDGSLDSRTSVARRRGT
jgi:hypothetical protein